jgi:hypothetical protein
MSDDDKEKLSPNPAITVPDDIAAEAATPKNGSGKAAWVGSVAVGVGSAALVAALMYAGRSRRKK